MEGMRRPESIVLPEGAGVPSPNVIVPPPNQFTHEVTRQEPYYHAAFQAGVPPDGEFAPGTQVIFLRDEGGKRCRVVDGRGLHVEVAIDSLKRLF